MPNQCPHVRPSQHALDVNALHGATIEPQASGPPMATLASELTVYTTENVSRTHGTGVREIVLRAFGDGLERAGAAYALGSVAANTVPVPETVTSTTELLDAFGECLPTRRASTRCNLLVVDEEAYDGPVRSRRADSTSDLGGLAVSRGAAAISRDLTVDHGRYGHTPGDYWLNRCLFAAASVYGVAPGQGQIYPDPDRDGSIATPAASEQPGQADVYDHAFADKAAETLQLAV